ncbi:putative efflux pump membrane fusion protein [Polystyrenella longa]|uniref:Putative efflux pump membrane fusion protein n=1 Tax=Polystyrenella longa TaxID=2528007 RepID=A0A518CRF4_9PLAN|nr:HlyD family efflux transporter periplasmic adaptor subunit [Polystyrenella longa]QDU81784.1 putative efflux pump membrane fusion protein [Polystyrenella longa]
MTRRPDIQLIACGLLLLLAIYWFSMGPAESELVHAQSEPRQDASELLVVSGKQLVRQHSFQKERTFTGMVRAKRHSELSFEVGGLVTKCLVDEGSRVDANAPLAILESDRLVAQQNQTKAKLAQAEARLQELVAGPRGQTIEAKRDQMEELKAMRDLAFGKKERSDQLHNSGAITAQERDQFHYDFLSVESRLSSAQEELNELVEGTRQEQMVAQKAVVQELQASLNSIEIDLEDATLKAPFAGTITSRLIDEGEVVDIGMTVFELIEDQSLEIWVGVPVELTAQIMQQEEFEVTINDQVYQVKRSHLIPKLNRETRTQSVLFQFIDESVSKHIYSGQIARFRFVETINEAGFWVPTDALVRGTRGLWSCYTLSPVDPEAEGITSSTVFAVERRDVEELYTLDGNVYVAGTLQEGDILLTEGTHRVVQGDRVRLNSPTTDRGESLEPVGQTGEK